MIDRA